MAGKLVTGVFLLFIGGLVNQWWNIPLQQVHQDDRLNAIEKHMEYNDQRLDKFVEQHDIMVRQLDDLKREMTRKRR
jgi:hypothetical protein